MKKTVTVLAAACAAAMAAHPATGSAADAGKALVDIHCHVAGTGAGGSGCRLSPALRRSWKYRVYLRAFGVSEREIAREGDELVLRRLSETLAASRRVSAAVVLALDGVVDEAGELDLSRTEMYVPNEFVLAGARRHSNLLYGASVNPYRKDAIARLERAAEDGAVLLKWLPSIQGIDPADPRLIPFYLRMKALGIPLLTHTGSESSFTVSDDRLSDPERLRLPLRLGVTVIAAHAGGGGRSGGERNRDRFLRLCGEFENLHGDISALTQVNRASALPTLLSVPGMEGRLLYGTDMPLPNSGAVVPLAFLFRIPPGRILAIARIPNPWDRDVALKEALGVPAAIGENGERILRTRGRRT